MTFKSKFIDGSDATEYQAMIAPLINDVADTVSESEEQGMQLPVLEWDALWSAMDAKPTEWIPTTQGMYYEMLGAVPPQDMGKGAFLVGEAANHNANGEAVYACFRTNGRDKYDARYMTHSEFTKIFGGFNAATR